MKVHGQKLLRGFLRTHANAREALLRWEGQAKLAKWASPAELKADIPSASVISRSRGIFNIKGNAFRLIAKIYYDREILVVLWIGTHAEYDRVDIDSLEDEGDAWT